MENERISYVRLFIASVKRFIFSKRYLIHLLLTFVLSSFSIQFLDAINQTSHIMPPDVFEVFKSGNKYNIGVLTVSRLDIMNEPYHDELLMGILSGSFFICIIASLISGFICSENKNGYVKIAITHGQSRFSLYNQYVLVSVLSSVPIIISSLIGIVFSLSLHNMLMFRSIKNILQVLILQAILIFFCSLCFACVAIIIKDYRAVAVCVSSVFIIPLLPGYIHIFTAGQVELEKFFLLNQLIHSSDFVNLNVGVSILTAVVTSAIIYIVGWLCFYNCNFD